MPAIGDRDISRALLSGAWSVLGISSLLSSGVPHGLDYLYKITPWNIVTLLAIQILLVAGWRLYRKGRSPKLLDFREDALALLPLVLVNAVLAQDLFRYLAILKDQSAPARLVIVIAAGVPLAALLAALTRLLHGRVPQRAQWVAVALLLSAFAAYRSFWIGEPGPRTAQSELATSALIVVDTARADAMDVLRSPKSARMPTFADFARSGITATNAVAASSWTMPSHAVLFSGSDFYTGTEQMVAESTDTIAEAYRARGFVTLGISANRLLSARGFRQGFDIFLTVPSSVAQKFNPVGAVYALATRNLTVWTSPGAESISDAATRLLRRFEDRPVFLFVNYMDAHDPYLPSDSSLVFYEGVSASDRELGVLRRPGRSLADFMEETSSRLTAADIEKMRVLYLACLTDWDRGFAPFLEEVQIRERLGPQFLAITSDHGELFGEEGGFFTHKNQLLRGELAVPLVIGGSALASEDRGSFFDDYFTHANLGSLFRWVALQESIDAITPELVRLASSTEPRERRYVASAMGPTESLVTITDDRGEYALDWLVRVRYPHAGVEALFANDSLVQWGSGPVPLDDESSRRWKEAAMGVSAEYFSKCPIVSSRDDLEVSAEALEALRALGYIR